MLPLHAPHVRGTVSVPLCLSFDVRVWCVCVCFFFCFCQVDDKSVAGGRAGEGGESPPRSLTVAELFDEDRLEMMSCKYADYDPARLAAAGGDWLEEYPNASLSPKAVS